jgi:hypothetical protein
MVALDPRRRRPPQLGGARALLDDGFDVVGEAEDGAGALSAIDCLHPASSCSTSAPDMDGFAVLERPEPSGRRSSSPQPGGHHTTA